jgi:hypothetical protein
MAQLLAIEEERFKLTIIEQERYNVWLNVAGFRYISTVDGTL